MFESHIVFIADFSFYSPTKIDHAVYMKLILSKFVLRLNFFLFLLQGGYHDHKPGHTKKKGHKKHGHKHGL